MSLICLVFVIIALCLTASDAGSFTAKRRKTNLIFRRLPRLTTMLSADLICRITVDLPWNDFLSVAQVNHAFASCLQDPNIVAAVLINTFGKKMALLEAIDRDVTDRRILQVLIDQGVSIHEYHGAALVEASKHNLTDVVHFLLENSPVSIQTRNAEALQYAVRNNNLNLTIHLFEKGASIKAQGYGAWRIACQEGHFEIVQFFIKAGVDQLRLSQCLLMSASFNNSEIAKMVLEHGADVHFNNDQPLIEALGNGFTRLAGLLLNHGSDINSDGTRVLVEVSENNDYLTMQFAIQNGALVNSNGGRDAVFVAVQNGYLNIIELLSEYGMEDSVFQQNNLLIQAIRKEYETIVEFLLDQGADVSENDGAALIEACKKHSYSIFKLVFDQLVPDISRVEKKKDILFRASFWAFIYGNADMEEFIISCVGHFHESVPETEIEERGGAELKIAVSDNNYSAVSQLLDYDLDSDDVSTALIIAACEGHLEVFQLLLDYPGVDIHLQDEGALICAARGDYRDIVVMLIEKGANIHAQNDEALMVGIACPLMMEQLLSYGANIAAQNGRALILAVESSSGKTVSFVAEELKKINRLPQQLLSSALQLSLNLRSEGITKKLIDLGAFLPIDAPFPVSSLIDN